MYHFILLIHVFAAVFVVALVLVQQGKGATVGAAFGSGASQTVFGSRGSGSFLFRVTMSLAAIFFVTSIALNYIAMHAYKQEKTLSLPIPVQHKVPAPVAPAPVSTAPAQPTPPAIDAIPSPAAPKSMPIDLPTVPLNQTQTGTKKNTH